jgi:hypothetical protein
MGFGCTVSWKNHLSVYVTVPIGCLLFYVYYFECSGSCVSNCDYANNYATDLIVSYILISIVDMKILFLEFTSGPTKRLPKN